MALSKARAARVPRRPTGRCAKTAEQASSLVKAPKITEPPRICTTTPGQPRTGRHHPRPPADRRPDAHRVPQLQDAGKPGCSTRPAHAALDATAAGVRLAFGRAATTVAILTTTWKQGWILVMAKCRPGHQP